MLKRAEKNLRERLGIKQKDWAVLLGAKPGTVAAAEAVNRKSLPFDAAKKQATIGALENDAITSVQKKQLSPTPDQSDKILSLLNDELDDIKKPAHHTKRRLQKMKKDYDRQMHALPIIQAMLQAEPAGTTIYQTLIAIEKDSVTILATCGLDQQTVLAMRLDAANAYMEQLNRKIVEIRGGERIG